MPEESEIVAVASPSKGNAEAFAKRHGIANAYSDYRDLAGVKVPFHWTLTWTDGRSEFEMTDVQPNMPLDAAKFGEPMLPKPATP
jgi:hypothetical protein